MPPVSIARIGNLLERSRRPQGSKQSTRPTCLLRLKHNNGFWILITGSIVNKVVLVISIPFCSLERKFLPRIHQISASCSSRHPESPSQRPRNPFLDPSLLVESESAPYKLVLTPFYLILRRERISRFHFRCRGEATRPCKGLLSSYKYLLSHLQSAEILQQHHPRQPNSLCRCPHSFASTSRLRLRNQINTMDSSHSPNTPNNTNSGPPPQQGGTSNGISASGSGEPTVGARNSSFGSSSEDEGRVR